MGAEIKKQSQLQKGLKIYYDEWEKVDQSIPIDYFEYCGSSQSIASRLQVELSIVKPNTPTTQL
jgi:hypothetical protein